MEQLMKAAGLNGVNRRKSARTTTPDKRARPASDLVEEAVKTAQKIAGFSMPAVMMVKESVNRAFETTLAEGVRFERRLFQSLFAGDDQKEGMAAFIAKREPQFKNR